MPLRSVSSLGDAGGGIPTGPTVEVVETAEGVDRGEKSVTRVDP